MPARKQRWEPQLNMAGNPVLDPTHRDVHPRSTFEANPGYNERRYNGGVHRSANTIAEAEADPDNRTGYGIISLDKVDPQGKLFRETEIEGGYGKARSDRVDAALKMAGTVGAAKERKRPPTPEEQREFEETGRVGQGIVHGKGEGKYGYSRTYFDDRPTELLHVVEGYNAKPSPGMVDAVKRSDVPAEHLLGLKRMNVEAQERGVAGNYSSTLQRIAVGNGQSTQKTMAHEIGHHVDNMMHLRGAAFGQPEYVDADNRRMTMRTTLPYSTGQTIGRAEGFADAYEAHHVQHSDEYSYRSLTNLAYERAGYGTDQDAANAYARERNRWGGVSEDSEWHDRAASVAKTDALPKPTGMWVDKAAGSATAAAQGRVVHQWVPGDEQGRFF